MRVEYSHLMDAALYPNHEDNFSFLQQYQYILQTSGKWKSFEPIAVTISIEKDLAPYAISLPMSYKGTRRGMQHYGITIPSGSRVTRNLHVGRGQMLLTSWSDIASDSYPPIVNMQFFWKQSEAEPDAALAHDYLELIAHKVKAASYLSPDDCEFLCGVLGINSSIYMARTPLTSKELSSRDRRKRVHSTGTAMSN